MPEARNLILPVLTICVIVALGYVFLSPVAGVVFFVAFGGGLVLYMLTSWRTRFDTSKVIVPYLLTVMLFLVHTLEEYLSDFELLLSHLSGQAVAERDFLILVAWLAPFLWVGGAVMLIRGWAYGCYFLCAFFVAMTIAELAHFGFPYMIDGTFHYQSGLYTAALPLIPAWYGLYVMLREIRTERARPADPHAWTTVTAQRL